MVLLHSFKSLEASDIST